MLKSYHPFLVVCLLGGCCLAAAAAEQPLSERPVVIVNGESVTLKALEIDLLKREGVDTVKRLVQEQLQTTDWAAMPDDGIVLAMANWRLPRGKLAAQLLSESGAKVREELINTVLVEQALRDANVLITRPMLEAVVKRMERNLHRKWKEAGQPVMPIADYIRTKYDVTMEEWMADKAIRMSAGLHALVNRRAEIPLEQLQRFYRDRHHLFSHGVQVDLQAIYLPFLPRRNDLPITDEDKNGTRLFAATIYRKIAGGEMDIGEAYARFRRVLNTSADPHVDGKARLGWVDADGSREQADARILPPMVMKKALAVPPEKMPKFLGIIEHAGGVELVQVNGRREARSPTFAEVKDEVRAAFIDAHLDQLARLELEKLRKDSTVEYHSLGQYIQDRKRQVGLRAGEPKSEPKSESKAGKTKAKTQH